MGADTVARQVAGVREHVTHAAAQSGLTGLDVTVTATPTVRVHVASPASRYGLANQVIDGPVMREVYLEPTGRVEHLSGPARFDRRVMVALFGATE